MQVVRCVYTSLCHHHCRQYERSNEALSCLHK